MKIAILTQPLCNNYGGILQNFALQIILKRLGHSPTTLNTPVQDVRYSRLRLFLSCIKRIIKKYILGDPSIIFINPQTQHNKAITNATKHKTFIDKYITYNNITLPITNAFCHTNQFDAYIVGSDQVWRPRYSQNLNNYYLDFTYGFNVKRIAYAASFGVDYWELSDENTTTIKHLVQQFDAISVREVSGINLCNKYLKINAQWVLDPTLLLNAEDYIKLTNITSTKTQAYIGVYLLDLTSEKLNQIKQISKETNLPIVYIGRMTKHDFPSVEKWLTDIANATAIITDSFHGTVFSIIFQKQFLSIINKERGGSRFESLLKIFDLSDRLHTVDSLTQHKLFESINYNNVIEKLKNYQHESIEFLQNYLNK